MENLADITGAGAVVALASLNITARWVNIIVSGAGTVRIGGPSTSSTVGLPVVAGAALFLPVLGQESGAGSPYSLREVNAYVPIGATVSVAYEPWN